MRIKNPIPKVEREKLRELQATVKALKKKANLTKEEIDKEK